MSCYYCIIMFFGGLILGALLATGYLYGNLVIRRRKDIANFRKAYTADVKNRLNNSIQLLIDEELEG